MTTPHKHAALIKAWADGAEIQCHTPNGVRWWDATQPSWNEQCRYRIKPSNVVKFLPVYIGGGSGKVSVGWGTSSPECAKQSLAECTDLKGVLRVEINPDTLELVSATMEAP